MVTKDAPGYALFVGNHRFVSWVNRRKPIEIDKSGSSKCGQYFLSKDLKLKKRFKLFFYYLGMIGTGALHGLQSRCHNLNCELGSIPRRSRILTRFP